MLKVDVVIPFFKGNETHRKFNFAIGFCSGKMKTHHL